jgi:hypothetical protein
MISFESRTLDGYLMPNVRIVARLEKGFRQSLFRARYGISVYRLSAIGPM